jgi:hypothetical protein
LFLCYPTHRAPIASPFLYAREGRSHLNEEIKLLSSSPLG